MEATLAQRVQLSATWVDSVNSSTRPTRLVRVSRKMKEQQRLQVVLTAQVLPVKRKSRNRSVSLEVPSCYKNFTAPILESGSIYAPSDEALILKNKSQEIEPYLSGRCIYLVGMMGSGKTTVGKIIAQALRYSFCDSDSLIEEEMDGTSVAEIFRLYGEGFFRDKETEALRKLSIMHRLVVSTGGGAVVRPINWKHMHKGISVWIDVPLEALAQRIAAVGTASRPLLHHDSSDDAYSKALGRLSSLFEERGEAYSNADARVSLENIAAKLGYRDVSSLSPAMIAIEALEQIKNYLEEEGDIEYRGGFICNDPIMLLKDFLC